MRISLYDFGRIVVDGDFHTRDLIIHPDRIEGAWWRKEGHRLFVDDLATVWKDAPDTIVVGTGFHGNMKVEEETRAFARDLGIGILAAPTHVAVTTFNELQASPGRWILAALHLTC